MNLAIRNRTIAVYTNKVYGSLKILKVYYIVSIAWAKCKCRCGVVKKILLASLKRGSTVSCGCQRAKLVHLANTKHGDCNSIEYYAWQNIKDRCHNKNNLDYQDYGGRGIKVYKPWRKSYKKFLEYLLNTIGRRHSSRYSIDRIDNDGNYEPGNIKWSTAKQQARNRRPCSVVRKRLRNGQFT